VVETSPADAPDPGTAGTAARFIERLAELRQWAGRPSLRRLRQLGGQTRAPSGDLIDALPPSTVSYLLRGEQLPRLDFVEAFVTACLRARQTPADQITVAVRRWQASWRTLAGPAVPPAAPVPESRGHRQLPSDIAEFTGRDEELRTLAELAGADVAVPGATPIAVIEGMAGVGKTRLAVRAAHTLAGSGRFDRSLHVDLHGFAEDQPPADPAAVLDALLRLLGVPGGDIPRDLSGRSALLRDRLHGTSTLLLLDDAASVDQVTPLLPACPTCLVLVTTRRTLPVDGAFPVRLKPFHTRESVDLLARLAGPARIVADPDGTAEVAARCGELPLAVALAGRRLHARDTWTVGDLAQRLRETDHRLAELRLGGRTVDAVFSLSYQALSEPQRQTFRMLALHPGSTFSAAGAAVLTGRPADLLESLVDDYLLEQPAAGRYTFHDLLREYACERLDEEVAPAEQEAAVGRLLRWYLATVAGADRLIDPHHRHVEVDGRPAGLAFASRDAALAWLTAEHASLVAAVPVAAARGEDTIAWKLAAALWNFLYLGKHWDDWIATHRVAAEAARRAGSAEGQAWILNNLGMAHWQRNDHEAAVACYRDALRLRRSIGDRAGEVVLLDNLGSAYDEMRRQDEAIECFERARQLAEQVSPPADLAFVLNNLGEAYRRVRRFAEAESCLTRALAIQQQLGTDHLRFTLCSLGELHEDLHDPARAEEFYRLSQERARQAGDGWLDAVLWEKLGATAAGSGDLSRARERWRESADAYARIGDNQAATRLQELVRDAGETY
jgi:tetratricopeptide (TPR) repeat protein